MSKVSIILCAYNAEYFLQESVQSVLNQTLTDIELIIVNDGSTDKTLQIANEFSNKDNRVKVISIENGGLANARNVGLSKATGDYIAFQDADDTVDMDCFFKMLSVAQKNNCDMVIAGYHHDTVLSDGSVSTVDIFEPKATYNNRQELFCGIVGLKSKFILDASWNKLYRHAVILDNGLEFPVGELFEDTAFVLSFLNCCCNVSVIPECFYHYMQRQGNSITKKYDSRKLHDLKKRYHEFCDFTANAGDDVKSFCSLYYIKNVFSALANSYSDSLMNKNERKALVKSEIKDAQFKLCAKTAEGLKKSDKLTVWIAKLNRLWLTCTYCRAINYMKTKMAGTFAKLK